MTTSLRLIVGGRWQADLAFLLDRSPDERVDPAAIRAPVDIVLAGRNVSAFLPDEPVLSWVDALCEGLGRVADGHASRALVPFEEAPWELAIIREGERARLWLYQVVAPGRVATEAQSVAMSTLLEAARTLVDDLADRARTLPAGRGVDEVLATLRRARRCLRDAPASHPCAPPARAPDVRVDTRSSAGFSFASEVRAWGPMASYAGEHGHDRLALLAPGTVVISPEQTAAARLTCRPVVALEQLVGALGAALALDVAPGAPIELVTADEGTLVLELGGGRALLAMRRGAVTAWHAELEATDLLTVMLEHVDDVVARLGYQYPQLTTNEVLAELRETADTLRVRLLRALGTPSVAATLRERGARPGRAKPAGARDTTPYPFEADNIHRMRHERVWALRRAEVTSVRVTGPGRWLIRSADALESIDLAEGRVAWRAPLSGPRMVVVPASRAVLVVDRQGAATERDLVTGAVTARAPARPGGKVAGAVRWFGETPSWALWDDEGTVRAIRPEREMWSVSPRPGVAQRVQAAGAALLCVGADGALTGLDPASGAVLYRLETGADDVSVNVGDGGVLVAAATPRRAELTVGILDATSGHWRCREELDGDWHDAVVRGGAALALMAVDGGLRLRRFDLSSGAPTAGVSFNEADLDRAVARLRIDGERVIVTQPGAVRAFALDDDLAPAWSYDAAIGARLAAPDHDGSVGMSAVVRDDDVVFVSNRSGRPVHAVSAFWEELAMLVVDERANMVVVERRSDGVDTVHGVPAVGVLATVSSR